MDPIAMGTKIIQSRPGFVFVRACHAFVALVSSVGWSNLMHTLLVSIQVVLGTEAIRPSTVGLLTFERLRMSEDMLPTRNLVGHGHLGNCNDGLPGFREILSNKVAIGPLARMGVCGRGHWDLADRGSNGSVRAFLAHWRH